MKNHDVIPLVNALCPSAHLGRSHWAQVSIYEPGIILSAWTP